MSDFDWDAFDDFPENEVECSCETVFRSYSRWTFPVGIVSRKPCPSCGRSEGHRASRSDVEALEIGEEKRR